jgi:dTDP-4-amino-4,6-dideoxygalactose transaminase
MSKLSSKRRGRERRETMLGFQPPAIGEEEIDAVAETLRSGWLTMGARVEAFEEALRDWTGSVHVVAVNSCTAALHLALVAHGIGPGDEVIVPTLTFAATGNVVEHAGARPVLVDVQERTGNLDPATVEAAITAKTKAIIPVHYAGVPCDMHRLIDIACEYDLVLIEDAAHAFGANHDGDMIGSIGSATCFSFYATKNLTTGEGGAVALDADTVAARIRRLRLHGLSRDAWKRYGPGASWRYDIEDCGFKYNMTDINAALGLAQLERFAAMQERREGIVARYDAAFGRHRRLECPILPGQRTSAHHLYPLRVPVGARDRFIEEMGARGIGCSVHFVPLHLHPHYQTAYGYRSGDFPVAEAWGAREVSLPLFPAMTDAEVEAVIAAVREVADGLR